MGEEGEEVVELVDYHGDEEDEEQLLLQHQGTGHNLQQSRTSMLVEGSRRSSFLEEQLSNEAYQNQQSYSGGRLSYYNDHQQAEEDFEAAISPNNNFCSPPHNQQHMFRGGSEVGVEGGQRRQSRIFEDQSGRYGRLLEEQPGWPGGQHQQLQLQQQHQYHQMQQQQHIYARGLGSQIAPPRPKNRNSNMLSAILCLIKEIDGPSLEVVELAARCRMEELDD